MTANAVAAGNAAAAGNTPTLPVRANRWRLSIAAPSRVPVGAFILIGLGVLFLLDELGVLHMHNLWRFWPLVLIALGIRVLMRRTGRSW